MFLLKKSKWRKNIMENKKITFEDIQKANETIKTTEIKGHEYAEVNQRIKAFRVIYPKGTIKTSLLSNENGVCIFRTEILDEEGKLLSTGTAYEKEGSSFINKTSYIENCETSAVGRALGMCGFGIDTSVASAEEVENADLQQEAERVIVKLKVQALEKAIENAGLTKKQVDSVINKFNYQNIKEIKNKDYGEVVNRLRAIKGENGVV